MRILVPDHPVFTFPNRITAADFDGWVQERDLYAFGTFDPRYTPLLESADPGEPPQRGGEVYAEVGKGRYVYTSYSWFRQLPAGVPGAYRQFANLVSLSKAPRRDHGRGSFDAVDLPCHSPPLQHATLRRRAAWRATGSFAARSGPAILRHPSPPRVWGRASALLRIHDTIGHVRTT